MNRREMAFHGIVALGVIVGIVGGNFALHRWMLGNTTSREADAGTAMTVQGTDSSADDNADLFDLKPTQRRGTGAATSADPAVRREQLKKLIVSKLPDASAEDQSTWLEKLEEVSLETAEGILDLRGELGSFDSQPSAETSDNAQTPFLGIQ